MTADIVDDDDVVRNFAKAQAWPCSINVYVRAIAERPRCVGTPL